MTRKTYHKLVRDKMPDVIAAKGDRAVTHMADDEEYWIKLVEKFGEDFEEFIQSGSEERLVDLLEILRAICEFKKIDHMKIDSLREEKAKLRGGFKKRIVLDETL